MTSSDLEIALLAPVPEEHLKSGMTTCVKAGKVAFGSRAWQVFRDLDVARDGEPVQVFIYGSHSIKHGAPKVRWRGTYIGHVEAKAGAHPDGIMFRPDSTDQHEPDNQGHWAVFWELTDLVELAKDEAIPINAFRGWTSKKNYPSSYIPEGPLLVETPEVAT
jgi:hypothetical protein